MSNFSHPGPPPFSTSGQLRGTTFCFVVYKEDLPAVDALFFSDCDDPRLTVSERISALGYSALISPEHQPDEECKKEHYHVIVYVRSQTTVNRAHSLFLGAGACFGGGGTVFVVNNTVGYTRYLCHLDNPEKQQWEDAPEDLILIVGDAKIILTTDKAEIRNRIMTEIENLIIDFEITSWLSLLKRLNPEQRSVARGYATYLHYLVNDCLSARRASEFGSAGEAGYFD